MLNFSPRLAGISSPKQSLKLEPFQVHSYGGSAWDKQCENNNDKEHPDIFELQVWILQMKILICRPLTDTYQSRDNTRYTIECIAQSVGAPGDSVSKPMPLYMSILRLLGDDLC